MRVLITGHRGYIGPIAVNLFQRAGHEVVGLDAALFRSCSIGKLNPIPAKVKDLRDVERRDFDGIDAVVHLAGLSNDPLGELDPALTEKINLEGAMRLVEIAKQAGVRRFAFASSCSVYGASGDEMVTEEGALNPVTAYARSKVQAEKELMRLADDSFCPVILRAATAYGVSPMIRFDLVINNLVAWAAATGRIHIKTDGTPWRPVVHIEDIARAYLAVVEAPQTLVHNQIYNVGQNRENYQVRELAGFVEKAVPGAEIEFASDAGPDKRNYRVDFTKMFQTFPNYRARWTALMGAQEVYQTIRDLGLRKDDFEGARYNRLDHVKMLLAEGRIDGELRWSGDAPTAVIAAP